MAPFDSLVPLVLMGSVKDSGFYKKGVQESENMVRRRMVGGDRSQLKSLSQNAPHNSIMSLKIVV